MQREEIADQRIEDLCDHFRHYVDVAIKTYKVDTPARHFHMRTIDSLIKAKSVDKAIQDDLFLDYLYATLVSWNMEGLSAKLVGFEAFRKTIQDNSKDLVALSGHSLRSFATRAVDDLEYAQNIMQTVQRLFSQMAVSATNSQLVANSKTIHHIVPNLIPPVDRKFTLKFFYNNQSVPKGEECVDKFIDVLSFYAQIYLLVGEEAEMMIQPHTFNSSVTKVIDNAIIGYCRRHFPKQAKRPKNAH